MRFSWTGVLLAPLLVPAVFSVAMVDGWRDGRAVLAFLITMIPGCVVSYGATVFLFLPSLFLLSAAWPMTGLRVCLLGLVLGVLVVVPVTWLAWAGSGPDSGPPTESFFAFFPRWAFDPFMAVCPLAGMVTAGLYWWLGGWRQRRVGVSGT